MTSMLYLYLFEIIYNHNSFKKTSVKYDFAKGMYRKFIRNFIQRRGLHQTILVESKSFFSKLIKNFNKKTSIKIPNKKDHSYKLQSYRLILTGNLKKIPCINTFYRVSHKISYIFLYNNESPINKTSENKYI